MFGNDVHPGLEAPSRRSFHVDVLVTALALNLGGSPPTARSRKHVRDCPTAHSGVGVMTWLTMTWLIAVAQHRLRILAGAFSVSASEAGQLASRSGSGTVAQARPLFRRLHSPSGERGRRNRNRQFVQASMAHHNGLKAV